MENTKSNQQDIKELYLCILNSKNLLLDGKIIQADRKLQSALTRCAFILKQNQDNELDTKNKSKKLNA